MGSFGGLGCESEDWDEDDGGREADEEEVADVEDVEDAMVTVDLVADFWACSEATRSRNMEKMARRALKSSSWYYWRDTSAKKKREEEKAF